MNSQYGIDSADLLDFNFIFLGTDVVGAIVHMYATIFGTQPHCRLLLHTIRIIHAGHLLLHTICNFVCMLNSIWQKKHRAEHEE